MERVGRRFAGRLRLDGRASDRESAYEGPVQWLDEDSG
jgi:hypothetical protein